MELGLDVRALSSAELDLGNRESRVNFLEGTSDYPGVLILNAGINEPEIFELQSDEAINRILEVNYFANINILQKVLPQMKKNNFGRIVVCLHTEQNQEEVHMQVRKQH
jgi:short-subunit dehydrogenase